MPSPCPTCRRPVEHSIDNPWRPFCSQRCKLIDLGAWAAEKHVIPENTESEPPPEEGERHE